MNYGFVRTACVTPEIKVADCDFNAQSIVHSIYEAAEQGAEIICLPELCLTGYTCGDLFLQPTLVKGAQKALSQILTQTKQISSLIAVGLPVLQEGNLYNCAVVIQQGQILGVVPKTFLPNYSEFYEKRHFTPAPAKTSIAHLCGQTAVFGTKLLFQCSENSSLTVAIEICEDLWAPLPPSVNHALAGATLVLNPSASDEIIGKAAYRAALVSGQSARLLCAYAYCDAGLGESTTDMVFAAHNLIAENGTLLAQSKLFANEMVLADVDVERMQQERVKNTSFVCAQRADYTVVSFTLPEKAQVTLHRFIAPFPFVPSDEKKRTERCENILTMQAVGLAKRLQHTHSQTAVVGISGGLDSCLALLVTVRAFELLQKSTKQIIAVTMPCFGTTARTKNNAVQLCDALGVTLQEVAITDTVHSNFKDIGHDGITQNVTYENVQARVRTLVLMNLANETNGLVIGTGDLSELALGWATYNGDHMSMYGVNASVPKTLIRHLVAYAADNANNALKTVLQDILETPVSPELLPAKDGEISQKTEDLVGPYELHDFFLYYMVRCSFSPAKIYFLAQQAFCEKYESDVLLKWLRNFYHRFFAQQFKRSCLPDGPKVGSVTLSPRGDWRMPSDASAALWLKELEQLIS